MKPLYLDQGHSLKVKKGKVWLLLDWWNNGQVPAKYVEKSDVKIVSLDVGLILKNSSTGYQVLFPVTLLRTMDEPYQKENEGPYSNQKAYKLLLPFC